LPTWERVVRELGRLGKSSVVPGLTQGPQLFEVATHVRPLVVLKPDKPVTSGDNLILIELSEGSRRPAKRRRQCWRFVVRRFRWPTVNSARRWFVAPSV